MINKIIEEIDKSLEIEAYLSALSLVLILPDICGKAEYDSNKKNKERYINWFDEYIGIILHLLHFEFVNSFS